MSHIILPPTFRAHLSLYNNDSESIFNRAFPSDPMPELAKTYPEDIGDCPLVRGLERNESYAVVQGSVAQDAGTKYGILRDVAGGVDAGKNIC